MLNRQVGALKRQAPCQYPRITYRESEEAKGAVDEEPRIRRVFCAPCGGWHLVIVARP